MVLMAASSDHHPAAKSSSLAPASPSPSTAPAATASSTRTRLHGFSFPTLSWGTHRLLRCSKNGASGSTSASPPQHPHTPSPEKDKPQDSAGTGAGASHQQRPWNLRTRRSATAAPTASRSEGAGKEAAATGGQALQPPAPPPAEARKRGLSLALTKEEIAEGFIAIHGTRPPRRPKKRPCTVQRQPDVSIRASATEIPLAGGSFSYLRVKLGDMAAFLAAGNILLERRGGRRARPVVDVLPRRAPRTRP